MSPHNGTAMQYLPGQAVVWAIAVAQAAVRDLPPAQPPQQGDMVLDVPGAPAAMMPESGYSSPCDRSAQQQ